MFLIRGALHRLTLEGLAPAIGPSFRGGPPSIRGALRRSEGALRLSEGPSVGQISPPSVKNIFLARGTLRRLTEVFHRPEGAPNRSVGSSIVGRTKSSEIFRGPLTKSSDDLSGPPWVLKSPPLFYEPAVGLQWPSVNMRRLAICQGAPPGSLKKLINGFGILRT